MPNFGRTTKKAPIGLLQPGKWRPESAQSRPSDLRVNLTNAIHTDAQRGTSFEREREGPG